MFYWGLPLVIYYAEAMFLERLERVPKLFLFLVGWHSSAVSTDTVPKRSDWIPIFLLLPLAFMHNWLTKSKLADAYAAETLPLHLEGQIE